MALCRWRTTRWLLRFGLACNWKGIVILGIRIHTNCKKLIHATVISWLNYHVRTLVFLHMKRTCPVRIWQMLSTSKDLSTMSSSIIRISYMRASISISCTTCSTSLTMVSFSIRPLEDSKLITYADSQFPSVYVGKEPKHFMTIEAVEANIKFLKTWKEDDPLPTNILDARMRAKFFGAEVITYRHFVLKILEHSEARSRNMEPATDEFRENVRVPTINKNDRTDEIHPQALIYAKRGLRALIQSTTAFHGLGEGRLIVTNVWGTAHA